jgi:hypothetical protein
VRAKPAKARPVNLVEILAGTLSAVSTAVAASFLGVTGTIVGAVVGSVLGTLATAFYAQSLTRGHDRLKALRPRPGAGTPKTAATLTGTVYGRRKRRWPLAVGTTAAAFALAIAGITTAELAFGHPLSNLFGGHATATTTITTVSSGSGADSTPADTGATPAPTTSAGADASTSPTTTTTPTIAPTDPAPTPTDATATTPAGPTTAATQP